jgi:hypothetical protein
VVNDYNQKWATRIIRGFGMATTQAVFKQMYEERYPAKE